MKVVLAEKPSVARDLAAHLGATARHEGWLEGAGWQVTWALGHLVELKEPEDYDPTLKRWSLGTLPFVPQQFELKVIPEPRSKQQFGVVKKLFRGASEIICATDAGREGELIFRFILEMTGAKKPVRRLWLSSLTEEAIREAFGRLKPASEYERLHAAARCRVESDWIVGLNATRFYTVRHGAGGLLWSVGRVQTPVLAMIADRDDEIRTFRPEPYWELSTRYRETIFRYTGDRFKKEDDAHALAAKVAPLPLTVTGVEKKPERLPPPQLFDLTELQREMNRRWALSAAETLKAAQALYEAKLITYPRTDSRYISQDMKEPVREILKKLTGQRPAEIGRLDLSRLAFTGRIVNDDKVADHHAIIPSGKAPGHLAPSEQKVFDAVLTRLIAAFYPPCEKEVTVVEATAGEVAFRARGVRIVEPGWTELYPRRKKPDAKPGDEEQVLPEFRAGESGPHAPFVERGETSPPKAFTENTLLGAMETAGKRVDDEKLKEALKEKGLGTPATRASIIETLIKRGYIVRQAKNLAATDLGRYLVALVTDRGLKSPEMTGEWESRLREMERGRFERPAFMEEIGRYIGDLIRSGGAPKIDAGRTGDCPRCGKPVIEGKRGWGCSGWRDGCPFVLWKEYRGRALEPNEVRELLQCGRVIRPISFDGAPPVILKLVSTGAITQIPVPTGKPQAAPPPPPPKETKKRAPRAKKEKTAPGEDQPAGPLGACPLCQSTIVETSKAFGCSKWKDGCAFAIWKTIAGKAISARTAKQLLTKGRTPLMKGFTSKAGKSFDAHLKLEGGRVSFEFAPR